VDRAPAFGGINSIGSRVLGTFLTLVSSLNIKKSGLSPLFVDRAGIEPRFHRGWLDDTPDLSGCSINEFIILKPLFF
jgi:hypothetical protein